MSPSEDDLRHALSDGGGERPDVERVVSGARDHRATRHKRLLSGAAAVVLVAAVATGGTLLARDGGGTGSGGTDAGGGADATKYNGPASVGTGTGAPTSAGTAGAASTCPPSLPTPSDALADPSGVLFAKPVASALVCAYPSTVTAPATGSGAGPATDGPSSLRLTGATATTLTDSLENAPQRHPPLACPDIRTAQQRTILVIAQATDGTTLPAVRTTIDEIACAVVVTNGSAVRYDWTPPASLQDEFAALTGAANRVGTVSPPSDRFDGSPAR